MSWRINQFAIKQHLKAGCRHLNKRNLAQAIEAWEMAIQNIGGTWLVARTETRLRYLLISTYLKLDARSTQAMEHFLAIPTVVGSNHRQKYVYKAVDVILKDSGVPSADVRVKVIQLKLNKEPLGVRYLVSCNEEVIQDTIEMLACRKELNLLLSVPGFKENDKVTQACKRLIDKGLFDAYYLLGSQLAETHHPKGMAMRYFVTGSNKGSKLCKEHLAFIDPVVDDYSVSSQDTRDWLFSRIFSSQHQSTSTDATVHLKRLKSLTLTSAIISYIGELSDVRAAAPTPAHFQVFSDVKKQLCLQVALPTDVMGIVTSYLPWYWGVSPDGK